MQNTFGTLSLSGGEVICLGNGVVISNDGHDNALGFAVPNIKVVANVGDTATIRNLTQTGQNTLDTFGRDDTDYYGLTIELGVQGYAVNLSGANSDIWECTITSTDINAYGAVKVSGNGPNKIANSSISNSSISSGYGIYINNTPLIIDNSTVFGGYSGIYIWHNNGSNTSMTINNSHIRNAKTDYSGKNEPGTILFFSNSSGYSYTVNLNNSQVESDGGAVISFKDGMGDGIVNLSNTKLFRGSTSNNNSAAVINANATANSFVYPDASSYSCNNSNGGGAMFNTIFADPGGNLTFNVTAMSAHPGGNTDIGLCN